MTVLLALGAALSWGTSDFFGGLAGRRSPRDISVAVALWAAIGGLVGLSLLSLVFPTDGLSGDDGWLAAAAGGAGAFGVTMLYRGLRIGRMGVVAPITGALAAAIPVVVGAAGGERPGVVAWAGILATLAAIVLASRPAAEHATGGRTGVLEAIVSGVGFGIVFTLLDATSSGSGLLVFVPMKATSFVVLLATAAAARQPVTVPRPSVPLLVGIAVFDNAANVFFLIATRSGLLTIAAVLSSLYPVVTVVLARFREHEHLARHQQVGLALALAGVVALATA
jgi:drug/metabolite transporter (DMT)-like permease